MAIRSNSYRLQAKRVFCTWPQTAVTPAQDRYGAGLEKAVIVQEYHENQMDTHLHALLVFREKQRFRNAACLDFVTDKHGNYQAARSIKKVLAYILKHDDAPATWPPGLDAQAWLDKLSAGRSSKALLVALAIKDGADLDSVNEQWPDFVLTNMKKVEEYMAYYRTRRLWEEKRLAVPGGTLADFPVQSSFERELRDLLGLWLDEPHGPVGDLRHLYLVGPTGCGKTYTFERLGHFFPVYWMASEQFFDGYRPDFHRIIVIDEFYGKKPITLMNLLCNPVEARLRVKGSQVVKNKLVLIVFLSNIMPHEAYSGVAEAHPSVLQAFERRLQVIRVPVLGQLTLTQRMVEDAAAIAVLEASEELPSSHELLDPQNELSDGFAGEERSQW